MAREKFKLNFITNGEGILDIDEPIGFDAVEFTVKQSDEMLGRDISFGGGESEFTFYKMRNHCLEILLYYHATFGWESQVQLIIEIDGMENIVGDLDFKDATTDQLDYFKCKVIQSMNQAIIKKRNEINVDLFSNLNVDLEPINPVSTQNILLKAMPVVQNSRWETMSLFEHNFSASSRDVPGISASVYYVFNPSASIKSSYVDDTLTFFEQFQKVATINIPTLGDDFRIIRSQNNLRNLKLDITNFDFKLTTSTSNGGDGYVDFQLELRYGEEFETATRHIFFEDSRREDYVYTNKNNYSFTIPYLSRGDSVWLFFRYHVRQSRNTGSQGTDYRFNALTTVNSMNVDVTATSVAYNTVTPSIRLYDGISQVVKSISGLETDFPFAQPNGEMYNQRIFNGNLLRNITDKPFNMSMKDIEKWLPEIYGGYEVNDRVFFGLFKDFYRPVEIGVFESARFSDYEKGFNKRYEINQLEYKYEKYASQKEKDTENSFDIVHGQAQLSVINKGVEGKKEISIGFVRDSFEIAIQSRKALDISDKTATQDDKTIYIIDTFERTSNTEFTEVDFLQHTFADGRLKLTNIGTFNFISIGLRVGEIFKINGQDSNAGTYTIYEVTDRSVILNGASSANNNGERNTSFTYIVSTITAPYVSWSNENFQYINGLTDDYGFANLKYTVKRNITRFYNHYLATSNIFTKKPLTISDYSNNRDLALSYDGVQTVEGESFIPENPILSPYVHNLTFVADFNKFKELERRMRTERGYIRTFDAKGQVIKVYIQEMTFTNSDEIGELKIIAGEEKQEDSYVNITYQSGQGYIIINNEYRVRKILYKFEGEEVRLTDNVGRLLYNPIFWHKVSVNGASPTSKQQLKEWLTLIS